jgi:hypothetical protein
MTCKKRDQCLNNNDERLYNYLDHVFRSEDNGLDQMNLCRTRLVTYSMSEIRTIGAGRTKLQSLGTGSYPGRNQSPHRSRKRHLHGLKLAEREKKKGEKSKSAKVIYDERKELALAYLPRRRLKITG